jgi:hypothetical protein
MTWKKIGLRRMIEDGLISWSPDWEKFGLRRMVGGGRFPPPGLIPGGTPFGLASEAGHVKSQRRSWREDTEDQLTWISEARACVVVSQMEIAPEGRRIVVRVLGSGFRNACEEEWK